ncbi:monocarboxylate transporter 7 [Oreochromis aureus]|uniref:Monocarboxylate transporter 7 n=1 Tax=Oreochromis aureus TaxID=47969 RepID=A0A668UCE6_OREAU|nr:monocarboxylate transporter 7 [Oreochromis aureus]XP_039472071.1 monocarboxylate transporter 7 [Oreochromis aureus]XP_039472072.1 monocarboxylate transporter 7 [Oreochromis aureus]
MGLSGFLGPNVYSEVPDGGWGWVVAVAFFLVEVFTYGTIKSFGIFLQNLIDEFGETNSRVSWIVSISVFVMAFNAPFASMMTNRFGFQLVVMTGGLLITSGTIATIFTSSINQIYITYGLVAGMGYCLTFLPTVTILSQYFNHRRSLATAVASTGESLSMFALAPAFAALRDHIGWRNTMAVLGALQSVIIICGALLRPIIIKPSETLKPEADTLTLKDLSTHNDYTEGTTSGVSVTNKAFSDQNTFCSLTNELTTGSVSTADSGVPSLNYTDSGKQQETALPHKEAKVEIEREQLEESKEEIKTSEKEEKTSRDAEKQAMKEELNNAADKKLSENNSKLLDFSILKECSFIFYSLFGLFATLGFFAPQLYIIQLSESRGVEKDHATYMLSTIAVAEILGRFSIGWILTRRQFRKKKLLVLLACVITLTVVLVGFTLVTEFYGLAVCCALYGFFLGTVVCTHIPLLAEDDVVGIERMTSAAGVYVFIQSFAGLAGPPLGGMLVDMTHNYGSAFYSCAAGMALSALFLGLVKPAKRGFSCMRRRRSESNAAHKEESEEQTEEN